MEALQIAKEAGAILSYDPNLRLPLWPTAEAAKEGIKSIWNMADIIKVWSPMSLVVLIQCMLAFLSYIIHMNMLLQV